MGDHDHRRTTDHSETAPLDPVALTLALWLGLVVCAAAIGRLGEAAKLQASLAQLQQNTPRGAAALTTPRPMRYFQFGG